MINTILYYPFISVCAESIPQYKLKVRSAILSPYRAELVRIIIDSNYNLSNYFSVFYHTPRKYFTYLIYFISCTWIIPSFYDTFIKHLFKRVFNQKYRYLILQNFYNKTKWKKTWNWYWDSISITLKIMIWI